MSSYLETCAHANSAKKVFSFEVGVWRNSKLVATHKMFLYTVVSIGKIRWNICDYVENNYSLLLHFYICSVIEIQQKLKVRKMSTGKFIFKLMTHCRPKTVDGAEFCNKLSTGVLVWYNWFKIHCHIPNYDVIWVYHFFMIVKKWQYKKNSYVIAKNTAD